jgi:hypothetical protein
MIVYYKTFDEGTEYSLSKRHWRPFLSLPTWMKESAIIVIKKKLNNKNFKEITLEKA